MRQQLIQEAMEKNASSIEAALNPIAKSFHTLSNVSSKHPLMTASLIGAIAAKFGPDVARRMITEANTAVQSISNPYNNNYYGY